MVKVKKREVLFVTIIVLVMLTFGFFISNAISDYIDLETETYTTAVQMEDANQFSYGMDTSFGNALVYGTIEANEPVTFLELGESFLEVTKTKEVYTMHTRTYTTTDSKGNTQTHTEVYWSWDWSGSETRTSETVSFLGHDFNTDQFRFNNTESICMPDGSFYNYEHSSVRYYYSAIPTRFDGTIHAALLDGNIGDGVDVFSGLKPSEVVSKKIEHKGTPVIIFWVVWVLFIGGAVVGFVYLDNKWLD